MKVFIDHLSSLLELLYESVILKSKFKKNFLNAPKKPNNGIKSKKIESRNIKWVHNYIDDDIQNLANDISMISMN